MSIDEVRERLAQGWSFADATMGKGWESKYPHIAGWQGGYGFCGVGTGTKIWLETYSVRPDVTGKCTTVYRLTEKVIPSSTQEEAAKAVNDAIMNWNSERGAEAILQYKKGWIGQDNWESKYPFISNWIRRSKRHCIHVEINCVTGESQVKAWLYDKPSNKETILFETRRDNLTEPEILKMLDIGIETWLRVHDSDSQENVDKHVKMLWSLESGLFDSIECPNCAKREVSAWFTNPAENEFRTWFVCGACGLESGAINDGKPKMFRADRIHSELQRRDEEITKQRKFPPPQG